MGTGEKTGDRKRSERNGSYNHDDYESTVDEVQQEMFAEDKIKRTDDSAYVKDVELELKATIKQSSGVSSHTFVKIKCKSDRVMEVIDLSTKSRRNRRIIEALLDNPDPEPRFETQMESDEALGRIGKAIKDHKDAQPKPVEPVAHYSIEHKPATNGHANGNGNGSHEPTPNGVFRLLEENIIEEGPGPFPS